MRAFACATITLITVVGFVFAFGGKTMNDRSNGAKVTSAGLLALSILIAFGV